MVETIGINAFASVPIVVCKSNAAGNPWGALSVNGYREGNLIYKDASKKDLLACDRMATGIICIPEGVRTIHEDAFFACDQITAIFIPKTVEKIVRMKDGLLFPGRNLQSITVDEQNLFYSSDDGVLYNKYKTSLLSYPRAKRRKSYNIEEGTQTIENYAFSGNYHIEAVTIPNNVTEIGKESFSFCSSLSSIIIPRSITSLKEGVFRRCTALSSVTLPACIQHIHKYTFWGCSELQYIYCEEGFDTSLFEKYDVQLSKSCVIKEYDEKPKSENIHARSSAHKPICHILSPPDGKPYSTPSIKLRYETNAKPGEKYTAHFQVNGKDVSIREVSSKGAHVVEGTEVELDMSHDYNRETRITMQVEDEHHNWSEPQRVTLLYESVCKPTLHVFAVGVNKYNKAIGVKDLNYAVDDAIGFAKTIANYADKNEYKKVDTLLLLDGAATRDNLEDQLIELTKRVQTDDIVMLFFSGHGVNINEETYFITSDAKDSFRGLSFHFIKQQMRDIKAKGGHIFIFIDACYSGGGKESPAKPITMAEPGVVGYYSSTGRQKSIEKEELRNGVFTYALIEGLKKESTNGEQVTISGLYKYILDIVQEKTDRDQFPILKRDDNIDNDYVIFYRKK